MEGDDLLGDGVNVAARLEQSCDPGGVLISGTAYDHLAGKIEHPFDFAGDLQLKNIARAVPAYRMRMEGEQGGRTAIQNIRQRWGKTIVALSSMLVLAVIAAGIWGYMPHNPADAKPSIAVLPFDNLGGDEATGRLADGVTEDIITDLARFRDLEVIARNSTMLYKGKAVDIREVGRDLSVRYVLEGSIQRRNDVFRVTAQLIDAETAAHIWSERWDRPVADIFAVQTELAEQLAGKIGGYTGTVLIADQKSAMRKRPRDLNAYDLYLLGIEAKNRETEESVTEAIGLFKRSLDIDPVFARAWTMLGSCYAISERWAKNWDETRLLYLQAVRKAVDLDPLDAEAHAGLGFALAISGEKQRAETEFADALRLNPNSADVLTRYSYWAAAFGRPEEGAAMAERAIRLNPAAAPWAIRFLRYAFLADGQFAAALKIHQRLPRTMFIDADFIDLAFFLAATGKPGEAKAAVAEALAAYPDMSIESWTGTDEWGEEERRKYVDGMRKAGFPPCASDAQIKSGKIVVRLPECLAVQ